MSPVARGASPAASPGDGSWTAVGGAAAVAAAAALFVVLAPIADVVGWVTIGVAVGVVGTIAYRVPAVRAPLLVALGLRIFATLVEAYVMTLPGSGSDSVLFENLGWAWSRDGWVGLEARFTSGAFLYSWMIGGLYLIADRSPLMVQVVNVLLGTLVVYNTFLIARILWGDAAARRAAWVAACFPTLVLFSAVILREQLVIYPLSLGVLCFLHWYRTNSVLWLMASVMCIAGAVTFHTGAGVALIVVLGYVVVRWARATFGGQAGTSLRTLLGFALTGGLALAILVSGWGRIDYLTVLNNTDVMVGYQKGGQADRTDYLTSMYIQTPADFVWQWPIRVVFFLFMPFPWRVAGALDLFGLVDSLLYMWLVWRALPMVANRGNVKVRAVSAIWLACIMIFALVVSNYGTAIRHRSKVAPLLIAVAAGGMLPRRRLGVEE